MDKDRFPSDTLSTHAIQPAGVQVLERIGVLDALVKVAPPMRRGRMIFDDAVAVVDDVPGITGAPVLRYAGSRSTRSSSKPPQRRVPRSGPRLRSPGS